MPVNSSSLSSSKKIIDVYNDGITFTYLQKEDILEYEKAFYKNQSKLRIFTTGGRVSLMRSSY